MPLLLWLGAYLLVGFGVAVLCFRYVFDDYDRDHFSAGLLWLCWWFFVPLFLVANKQPAPIRSIFRWCARRLPPKEKV